MQITSAGIIGFGDFGQFLFTLAKERFPNLTIKVYASRHEPDGKEFFSLDEVCKTDLVLVCVPIAAFAETIERIRPLLGATTIVVDVATVKTYTTAILQEKQIPRYLATHPMFGPFSYAKCGNSLDGLRIALCDTSLDAETVAGIETFLRSTGLKVLTLTSDTHDRLIAETLFLTHLVGQTIVKGGFTRTSIDTVSFGFLMDAVESVAHDEALFNDVYAYNPYCTETLARFEGAKREVVDSLLRRGQVVR